MLKHGVNGALSSQKEAVKLILSIQPSLITQTALHLATRGGHTSVVRVLIGCARKVDDEDIESRPHAWQFILRKGNKFSSELQLPSWRYEILVGALGSRVLIDFTQILDSNPCDARAGGILSPDTSCVGRGKKLSAWNNDLDFPFTGWAHLSKINHLQFERRIGSQLATSRIVDWDLVRREVKLTMLNMLLVVTQDLVVKRNIIMVIIELVNPM
ncbi:hypothetical protein LguiA_030202 [Lonicera macranthoides]